MLREVRLSSVVVVALLFAIVATGAGAQDADPLSGESLYADVVRYADFGVHRSGTPGDRQTSEWVARELREAGYGVQSDTWRLRQFFLEEATLTVDGESVGCFPFWYPHNTGEEPLVTRLALLEEGGQNNAVRGRVAFVEIEERNWRLDIRDLVDRAVRVGAVGLVVALPSPSGEPVAQNAPTPHNQEPHAIPAMIVSAKDAALLRKAARDHAKVELVIRGRDVPDAESANVVAKLVRGEKWIVLTTPLSGWFGCAGERGPGVALFLGLARWLAERETTHSILLLGNTGHELDQVGAHDTLEANAPPPEDVSLWIHLGASITAREYEVADGAFRSLERVHAQANLVGTPELLPALQRAFAEVPGVEPRAGGPVFGELAQFMEAGYNAYGFFGSFLYFHTWLDTPATTSPELLGPVAEAIAETIAAID